MIDKDKLHAFLFASLYPNETSDDRRYEEGFRKLARDKAYEKATDLTKYYVERSEKEKVLPKGVDLPHFNSAFLKFCREEVLEASNHPINKMGLSFKREVIKIPSNIRMTEVWRNLNFKPQSEDIRDAINEFAKTYTSVDNIRSLYDVLYSLKYIEI